jgi:hypothetical protein
LKERGREWEDYVNMIWWRYKEGLGGGGDYLFLIRVKWEDVRNL